MRKQTLLNMSDDDLEAILKELENIYKLAANTQVIASTLGMAEVKGQFLLVYALYKVQMKTMEELKKQSLWTKRLAIGTFFVAATSLIVALVSHLNQILHP
jgi:hypothetical protein